MTHGQFALARLALAGVALGASLLAPGCAPRPASELLYRKQPTARTRWASFENPSAAQGQGGRENRGAKGHAFDSLPAGKTVVLLDVQGSGAIRRMWFTLGDRDPRMLRSLRLDIYWDGAATPAVSVPFGDFVGAILGRAVPFESELFANPEGRSFNCYIPMPFATAAKVTLTNESPRDVLRLFYDVDVLLTDQPDPDALYFHATWRRERWTTLGKDFEILPTVKGHGRFLGAHVGVIGHPDNVGWWGEGEVKMYLDGDGDTPTLVGTGAEDYVGTGWGQGVFHQRFQGSLVADKEHRQYAFYRYHVPDPVYFQRALRVTIQQLGGAPKSDVLALLARGVPVKPVSIDDGRGFTRLLEGATEKELAADPSPPDAWTNMYRRDDYSAVALFYLDAPENGLPKLAPAAERVEGLLNEPSPAP